MTVSHIPLDLRLRCEGRNGVHDYDINSTASDKALGNLQCLLSVIGLAYPELIDVYSKIFSISRIKSMLSIYECCNSSAFLRFCNRMEGESRLTRAFRSIYLYYPSLGKSPYSQSCIQCNGTGGTTEGDECSDGEVSGSQSCNGCGEQTTKKCVNGKWTDSLGTCSKTAEECNTCQESTTSWTDVSSLPQDTCPGGNTDVEFSCDGGFVGTCTDVRSTPADRQIGETNTLAFDPPSGYVWGGPTCSPQQRKEKAKVASGFASESIISRHNYAIASCSDLSSGNMVNNLPWGFHLLAPGGGIEEWVDYGVITKECPVDLSGPWDGGYEMCRRICGITDPTDTHGCRSRERCYVKPQFNNECGNLTAGHPVLGNGFSVYTCDEHAGGRKWKFRLYQCDAKYEKRTVTCCGN